MQLSHADPNKIRAAYNHADYVEQRRMMMQEWADRLDGWERGEPVVRPVMAQALPHSLAGIESYLQLLAQGRLPQPGHGVIAGMHGQAETGLSGGRVSGYSSAHYVQ